MIYCSWKDLFRHCMVSQWIVWGLYIYIIELFVSMFAMKYQSTLMWSKTQVAGCGGFRLAGVSPGGAGIDRMSQSITQRQRRAASRPETRKHLSRRTTQRQDWRLWSCTSSETEHSLHQDLRRHSLLHVSGNCVNENRVRMQMFNVQSKTVSKSV